MTILEKIENYLNESKQVKFKDLPSGHYFKLRLDPNKNGLYQCIGNGMYEVIDGDKNEIGLKFKMANARGGKSPLVIPIKK